ncbi:MAG TPA: phospho-N-acetylmuramoyl-pentapeptide-transferase [Candidatus Acidoferrum sp.]|nr:phospho-N-acetylmuramoyl-pentapeptide-transferase [Candidatus Acidoferrum sp.]
MAAGTALEPFATPLRLFRYITFRSAGAAVTALLLSWWLYPRFILWLKRFGLDQNYEDRAHAGGGLPAAGPGKKGTPTMGGLLIVLVLDVTAMLWAQWNTQVLLALFSVIVLCGLGFIDDYAKVARQNSQGLREFIKLWVQGALALFAAGYLWRLPATTTLISEVMVPFYKYPVLTGVAGAAVGMVLTGCTIVGASNAVNLTDGLDGLAIGCTVIVSFVFLVLTYLAGNARAAAYLQIPHVPGAGELTVFCAAMLGAGLGFLWFNCHPACLFMGDTGSLALGGGLGMIAVLIHQPLVLAIAGGVFVAEAGSVIVQRLWFKISKLRYGEGRRVFLMAPLHHHFQKLGWHDTQIVTRFYILGVLCAVVAFSTLKIR